MRRYSGSKIRIALLAAMLAVVLFSFGTAMAQDAAAPAAGGAVASRPGMFRLLMGLIGQNLDIVFVMILVCSIIAVTLMVKAFIQIRASVIIPESSTATIREMIANRQFKELIEFTETDPSFVSKALNPALKRAPSFSSMKEALETAVGENTAEQFRKIEYLNIIGNLGPLLGLLGTVLGMIDAFSALQAAGGAAKPAELAGGISAALTHTFLGLMLAVPCLAAFGVLRTMVDRLTIRGSLLAEEMLLAIKPQESGRPATPAGAPAVKRPAGPVPVSE